MSNNTLLYIIFTVLNHFDENEHYFNWHLHKKFGIFALILKTKIILFNQVFMLILYHFLTFFMNFYG